MVSIIATTTVALFLQQFAVPAVTTSTEKTTAAVESQLYRICQNASSDQVDRCKARQRERLLRGSTNSAVYANEVYDRIDLGQNHLRNTLQERRLERAKARAETRKTFRQSPTQQDTSLQPVSYVDYIREGRLKCMLITRARPRSICIDNLNNEARKLSKEEAENRTFYIFED